MTEARKLISRLPGKEITSLDVDKIFQCFDTNRDGALDKKELKALLSHLATSGSVVDGHLNRLHSFLDADNDGVVSRQDFRNSAGPWLSAIFNGSAALVIVDVQNDFISGSLALKYCEAGQDGAEVVPVINSVLDKCASLLNTVVYSLDWHPADHISFIDNVGLRDMCHGSRVKSAADARVGDTVILQTGSYGPVEQKLWPRHCVQGSQGSELHPSLKVTSDHIRVFKGTDSDIDSYSAFCDNDKRKKTDLFDQLHRLQVRDVFVCGLATDVCVGATATHSVEYGFRTALLEDASRGVSRDSIASLKARLVAVNGLVVNSSQLRSLLQKTDRPIEWVVGAIDSVRKLKYT